MTFMLVILCRFWFSELFPCLCMYWLVEFQSLICGLWLCGRVVWLTYPCIGMVLPMAHLALRYVVFGSLLSILIVSHLWCLAWLMFLFLASALPLWSPPLFCLVFFVIPKVIIALLLICPWCLLRNPVAYFRFVLCVALFPCHLPYVALPSCCFIYVFYIVCLPF